jgi:hypothetical protein
MINENKGEGKSQRKWRKLTMNKTIKNLLGLILIVVIMILGYEYSTIRVDYIKENGSLTLGKITRVDDGGEAFDMSATYEYQVENKLYSRKVEIDPRDRQRNFKGCLWSTKDCSGGFAWVLYSMREPGKSLINHSRIYSAADTFNLNKPTSFEGFY